LPSLRASPAPAPPSITGSSSRGDASSLGMRAPEKFGRDAARAREAWGAGHAGEGAGDAGDGAGDAGHGWTAPSTSSASTARLCAFPEIDWPRRRSLRRRWPTSSRSQALPLVGVARDRRDAAARPTGGRQSPRGRARQPKRWSPSRRCSGHAAGCDRATRPPPPVRPASSPRARLRGGGSNRDAPLIAVISARARPGVRKPKCGSATPAGTSIAALTRSPQQPPLGRLRKSRMSPREV
jgi:hypothetical protein